MRKFYLYLFTVYLTLTFIIDEDIEVPQILGDSFQRVSLRNEILVSHFSTDISNKDITPPGRITDVDVIDISTEYTKYGEKRNFTIKWTAPGDDINIGQGIYLIFYIISVRNSDLSYILAYRIIPYAIL